MPAALFSQLVTQAGEAGDPAPSNAALFVRTTARRVRRFLQPVVAPTLAAEASLAPSTVVWVAEMSGRFYQSPGARLEPFTTYWTVWSPERSFDEAGAPAIPLQTLARLGALHSEPVRPPGAGPTAPAGRPPAALGFAALAVMAMEAQGYPVLLEHPGRSAWVGTTAGRLRAQVPYTGIPHSVPAGAPVWVAQLSGRGEPAVDSLWVVAWRPAPLSAYTDAWANQGDSDLLGITRLSQLGRVHSFSLGAALRLGGE